MIKLPFLKNRELSKIFVSLADTFFFIPGDDRDL